MYSTLLACLPECAVCNEDYECEECSIDYMLVDGECLNCTADVCAPMNYYFSFVYDARSLLVLFDFPVSNLNTVINSAKVQIFTSTQKLYNLNISSVKAINETAFNITFNLTASLYSNDTLTVYIDDNLYNSRQGVSYPIVQFQTNPPYTFVCITKCRDDPTTRVPLIFPIAFFFTCVALLVCKVLSGSPISMVPYQMISFTWWPQCK